MCGRTLPTAKPDFAVQWQVIDYSPITSMYGAVHCSSQVVRRAPRTLSNYNAASSAAAPQGSNLTHQLNPRPTEPPSGASSLSRQLASSKIN